MANGTIQIEFTGSGFKVRNGGGAGTFKFLCGLQKRGLFNSMQEGPNHRVNWIEKKRVEKFQSYCEAQGFEVVRV
jgi:hypothetical protein